jgi:aminocarboxymuconate-semialdehyde decarboxylase
MMDKIGLDMEAISILPTHYYYSVDADLGLKLSQKQNDHIAEIVRAYPDRFVGMATVPMQDAGKAAAELERAIKKLGFKAVEINTNVNGKNLDEPEFLPLFEKAQTLDIPIFLHPHYVLAADRLKKHYLMNLIGNPVDTTVAIASLIFGGVMEKFPKLKFICAHAGGTTPFIKGRWEHGFNNLVAFKHELPRPPSKYIKGLYFDTITHYKPALLYMIADHGADHIVIGSDCPADMGDPDPVSTVRNLRLPAKDEKKIMWENAATLLKL